ncbi:MAG: T9SS type A sorting domain-containing protein [Bacteroidota bacterium]
MAYRDWLWNFILTRLHYNEIFPNPAHGFINIQLNQNTSSKIQILNTNAQVVKRISTESDLTNIDIQDLPNGLYFIKVNNEKVSCTRKFVVH